MTSPLHVSVTDSFLKHAISSDLKHSTKIGTDAPGLTVATIAEPAISVTRTSMEQPLAELPVFFITINPLKSRFERLVKWL